MKRTLLLLAWMLLAAVTQAADEIEPLDGDFLEYLANMEEEDDDWTLLDDAPPKANAAQGEQAAKKSETPKEAAKPAVEDR